MDKCERCNIKTCCTTMSMFNTQMICESCQDKEMKHPDYQKAKDAEASQVKLGSYNFEGIGLPDDL